ncbi:unnamed protein product [Closterium sp. NIES-53]
MEGLMFKEWSERGRSKVTIPLGMEVGTNNPLLIPIEFSSSSELTEVSHDLGGAEGEAADVEEVMQQGEAPVAERGDTEEEVQQPTPSPKLPPRRTTQGKRDAFRGGAKEGEAKERPKRAAHPRNFLKYERLGVPKVLLVQEEEYEEEKGADGEMEQICCFGINLPHEPASMEEALAGDDREAWLASREDEFQSHMENETWNLTNLPPGRKALDCTWVLRVKTDAEGRLERRKTRLVIKGFQQREGIDFQEVFAPVAKAPTLRLCCAKVLQWHGHRTPIQPTSLLSFWNFVGWCLNMSLCPGVDYPEKIKCYKALSLLPESWGPLVVNLNGMKDSWSLEWIRAQVLQEEFRRKELTAAAGEGGGSAYGMKGLKGRGSKKGKAKEGSGGEQYSGGKRSNKGGKRCGGKCWYCHVEGHPWFKCRKLLDGWRPGQPSIEGSNGVHGAMREGMGSEEGDGGAGGHGGMFYHVGEASSEDMGVPASKVALHRSSHLIIDTGPFMTMTNREDLLDEVRPSKAATVVSATGQVVPVRGEGRAMFMGADGRLLGLKRVLLVPGLCANLLSTKALSEAGMKMEMMGTKLPPRRTTQGKRDAVRGGAKEGEAKERPKRAAHPRDFLKYERLGVPKALLVQEEEYEEEKGAEGEMEQICCFGVNLSHEPASMEEALAGDDREAWLASREDEFQSHMENETWTLTNLPPRRKALDGTWVLRVKTDAEGRLERRKTRLVIKGFQQREGIDFQEVFAPVAKAPTLRLLLAAAAVCGWKVEQMDVKTAFLYGVVDEEIYMKQPEGYDDGSGRVCRLNKAIYGLKQALRC